MNKSIILSILLCFSYILLNAQLNGIQWVLTFNTSIVDFRNDTITERTLQPFMASYWTMANICDENGNLLYFTNGIFIAGSSGKMLQNGDGLSPCPYTSAIASEGMSIPQGALFLPEPGNSRYYYLFHFSDDTINDDQYRPATLYYSIIDKEGNGGLGAVIEKNVIFYYGVFRDGGMSACKHANGRDWWIVMGNSDSTGSNQYTTFLLTPNGISDTLIQSIGPAYFPPYDVAYSKFTLDGGKYVTVDGGGYVTVMDFDRCSGQFSNPVAIYNSATTNPDLFQGTGGTAVEFSPNGRFVYVADRINMTEYDLLAENIQDSTEIYTADSNDLYQISMIQLAPNGKIYGSTWNGGAYFLHVISNPDGWGDSCGFVYGGLKTLTVNSDVLPNMVNYELGPLITSSCDTLTGLSQTLSFGEGLRIHPNPADKYLYVEMPMQGNYELDLLNGIGQVLAKKQTPQIDIFDTEGLPAGVYFIKAIDKQSGYNIAAQKVVVAH